MKTSKLIKEEMSDLQKLCTYYAVMTVEFPGARGICSVAYNTLKGKEGFEFLDEEDDESLMKTTQTMLSAIEFVAPEIFNYFKEERFDGMPEYKFNQDVEPWFK